jgi:hypothetical protein
MGTRPHVRRRFWLEIAVVVVSLALWGATLVRPDWIELVFGIDPDEGSGSLERAITILVPAVGLLAAVIASLEWRRPRSVSGEPGRW